MAVKQRLCRKTTDGMYETIHLETSASLVLMDDGKTVQEVIVQKANASHTHNYAGASTAGGAATSATKLATTRYIDGVGFNGSSDISHYGKCSTSASVANKTVTCTGFSLKTGAIIRVKFTITNTAANPTLNVNSTGAKPIYYRGSAIAASYLEANRTYEFIYNGTEYEFVGDINTDTNTTYTPASATPKMNGTGAVGTSSKYAREDHVHPTDTSRAPSSHTHSGYASSSHTHGAGDITSGILPVARGGTGNANGTVARLTTPRTFRTNLASTSTASFDGSANATPGVTGILPIANGGTGVNSKSALMDLLGISVESNASYVFPGYLTIGMVCTFGNTEWIVGAGYTGKWTLILKNGVKLTTFGKIPAANQKYTITAYGIWETLVSYIESLPSDSRALITGYDLPAMDDLYYEGTGLTNPQVLPAFIKTDARIDGIKNSSGKIISSFWLSNLDVRNGNYKGTVYSYASTPDNANTIGGPFYAVPFTDTHVLRPIVTIEMR